MTPLVVRRWLICRMLCRFYFVARYVTTTAPNVSNQRHVRPNATISSTFKLTCGTNIHTENPTNNVMNNRTMTYLSSVV